MSVKFAYWSDPLCVWAYVAQSKLDAILDEFGDAIEPDYRVVPVFGSIPFRFTCGSWAEKGVEGRIASTQRTAEKYGRGVPVTGEVWAKDPPTSSWGPGSAIKAVQLMEKDGLASKQDVADYQWQLRRSFFEDNVNIARREHQLAVAEAVGVDRAGIEERLDDGRALASLFEDHQAREKHRIQGSPTYVFDGGRGMLYGNFAFGVLHATVQELIEGTHEAGGSLLIRAGSQHQV